MSNLLKRLQQWLRKTPPPYKQTTMQSGSSATIPAGSAIPELTPQSLKQLMNQIEQTHTGIYTCEETFALLDEYVDLAVSEQNAAALMPLVERHLAVCEGCRDEYEILLDILRASADD